MPDSSDDQSPDLDQVSDSDIDEDEDPEEDPEEVEDEDPEEVEVDQEEERVEVDMDISNSPIRADHHHKGYSFLSFFVLNLQFAQGLFLNITQF